MPHHQCLKPAICKAGASGQEHTSLREKHNGTRHSHSDQYKGAEKLLTGFTVTFEAAESANEEEADFIPVNIIHEFKLRSRTCGASGRLQRGVSLPWHHGWGHA